MNKGRLIGIGVGCGSPADLTYAAKNAIENSDIVIFPAGSREHCRAYTIVRDVLKDGQETEFFDFPMTRDKYDLIKRHSEIYKRTRDLLDRGKTVSFITIGDPLIYSTFSYIGEMAERDGYEMKIINGIPSFLSCAGRLALFLGQEDEEIHIIPGSADLKDALSLKGIKIFMKLGKKTPALRQAIKTGDHTFLGAVSHCGMSDERIYRDLSEIPDEMAYLMTAFVR